MHHEGVGHVTPKSINTVDVDSSHRNQVVSTKGTTSQCLHYKGSHLGECLLSIELRVIRRGARQIKREGWSTGDESKCAILGDTEIVKETAEYIERTEGFKSS